MKDHAGRRLSRKELVQENVRLQREIKSLEHVANEARYGIGPEVRKAARESQAKDRIVENLRVALRAAQQRLAEIQSWERKYIPNPNSIAARELHSILATTDNEMIGLYRAALLRQLAARHSMTMQRTDLIREAEALEHAITEKHLKEHNVESARRNPREPSPEGGTVLARAAEGAGPAGAGEPDAGTAGD